MSDAIDFAHYFFILTTYLLVEIEATASNLINNLLRQFICMCDEELQWRTELSPFRNSHIGETSTGLFKQEEKCEDVVFSIYCNKLSYDFLGYRACVW